MRSLLVPAAIAACAATFASPAAAQRRASPTRQQFGQLQAALDSAARSMTGYRSSGSSRVGPLMDDSSETWEPNYAFHANGQYAIVGVCIEGCTNLDIRVLKADGSQLATENRAGSTSSVEFTAAADGSLRFVARMTACPEGTTCWYGLKLLSK